MEKRDWKKLSMKRRRFVMEYLRDFNASAAARRAGYSAKTSDRIGSYLMNHVPEIRQAIESLEEELQSKITNDHLTTLKNLQAIVKVDPRRVFDGDGKLKPIHELDDETAAAISHFRVKEVTEGTGDDKVTYPVIEVKFYDKNTALANMMKHQDLLRERVEHSGGVVMLEPESIDKPDESGRTSTARGDGS